MNSATLVVPVSESANGTANNMATITGTVIAATKPPPKFILTSFTLSWCTYLYDFLKKWVVDYIVDSRNLFYIVRFCVLDAFARNKHKALAIGVELILNQAEKYISRRQLQLLRPISKKKVTDSVRLITILFLTIQLLALTGTLLNISPPVFDLSSSFIPIGILSKIMNIKSLHLIPAPLAPPSPLSIKIEVQPSGLERPPRSAILLLFRHMFGDDINQEKYTWLNKTTNWAGISEEVCEKYFKEDTIWDTFLIICMSYAVEVVDSLMQQQTPYLELGVTPYYLSMLFDGVESGNSKWSYESGDNLLFLITFLVCQIVLHFQAIFKSYDYRLIPSTLLFGPFVIFQLRNILVYGARQFESSIVLLVVVYPLIGVSFFILCSLIYLIASLLVGGPSKMRTPFGSFKVIYKDSLHAAILRICGMTLTSESGQAYVHESKILNAPTSTWIERSGEIDINDSYKEGYDHSDSTRSGNLISWFRNVTSYSSLSIVVTIIEFFISLFDRVKSSLNGTQETHNRDSSTKPFTLENLSEDEESDEFIPDDASLHETDTEEVDSDYFTRDNSTDLAEFQELMVSSGSFQTLMSPNNQEREVLFHHLSNNSNQPLTRSRYRDLLGERQKERVNLIRNRWNDIKNESGIKSKSTKSSSTESDDEDLPPSSLCVVCMSAPRNVVLWPCGCLLMCESCREALSVQLFSGCVSCRRKVTTYSHITVSE